MYFPKFFFVFALSVRNGYSLINDYELNVAVVEYDEASYEEENILTTSTSPNFAASVPEPSVVNVDKGSKEVKTSTAENDIPTSTSGLSTTKSNRTAEDPDACQKLLMITGLMFVLVIA